MVEIFDRTRCISDTDPKQTQSVCANFPSAVTLLLRVAWLSRLIRVHADDS